MHLVAGAQAQQMLCPREPTSVIFQMCLVAWVSVKLFSEQRGGDNSLKNEMIPRAVASMKMESLY